MQKIRANLDGFRCRIANELGELFDTHLLLLRNCVGISVVCQNFTTNNRRPRLGPPYTTPPKYRAQSTSKLKAALYTTHSSLQCSSFSSTSFDTRATNEWPMDFRVEIWREKNEFSGKVCVLFSKRDTNKNVHEPETNETMSRPVFAVCAVLALISQVCTHAAYCSVCLSHLSLCTPCSLHDKRLRAHVVCIVSSKIFTI